MNEIIPKVYDLLYSHFGETGWWPAESPEEVVMGAILTQNTAWKNVEISINKLKSNGITTLAELSEIDEELLGEVIRSSGFFRQKSRTLKNISKSILENYVNLENMKKHNTPELKVFLSSLKGIGQETMNCILLYVLDKPEFVVDKYTLRIFGRIGISRNQKIGEVKELVEEELRHSVSMMKNLHGMIVELGKNFCRVKPQCTECPLKEICEYGSLRD